MISGNVSSMPIKPRDDFNVSSPSTKQPAEKSGKMQVGLVDSGMGGAMAGRSVGHPIKEFGSIASLPIGDKNLKQIESYTAQMILQGLLQENNDQVIIACNTASTSVENGLKLAKDFIANQTSRPGESVLSLGNLQRAQNLQSKINENPDYLSGVVHEIVKPTSREAVSLVMDAFIDKGKNKFSIIADSTLGTAKSGAYPSAIAENLDASMSAQGFQRIAGGAGNSITSADGSINKTILNYKNAEGDTKTLGLQSRGNPAWVPVIEAGTLDQHVDRLVNDSRSNSDQLKFTGEGASAKNALFDGSPDLSMLCCTHYPAMRSALSDSYGEQTNFLSQDGVVAKMVDNFKGEVGVTPETPISVTLGSASLTSAELSDKQRVIQSVVGDHRPVTVGQNTPEVQAGYEATHKDIEFNRPGEGRNFSPDGQVLHVRDSGVHTAWKQNKADLNPGKRADAQFLGSIPADSLSQQSISDAVKLLKDKGLSNGGVRSLLTTISQIGRLMTGGEARGLDILASKQEPGAQLFNAAVDMASVFDFNAGKASSDKQNIAIMTGFTVVDNDGNKVAGENDGPPGAVMLAKQTLDHNSPATLVFDKGSEASVFAAAKGAGLVVSDGNTQGTAAANATFDGAKLVAGLSVEVVDHGPGSNTENPLTAGQVKQNLMDRNTSLMISIERPGPNEKGELSSMRGQDISKFNADLSSLIGGGWKTIGIGDGGNEIGTGGASDDTKNMRKPDYTPVVNSGNKIAAETKTDRMVLASVSNNGGVALSVSAGQVAKAMGVESAHDPELNPVTPSAVVDNYMKTVASMFKDGMSIDGVNKDNALTVDGRKLSPDAGNIQNQDTPVKLGSPEASHRDMFNAMLKIKSS